MKEEHCMPVYRSYREAAEDLRKGHAVVVEQELPDGTCTRDQIAGNPQLVVFGCGHVGACTAKLGKELEYHVIMADPRSQYADPMLHPYADQVICKSYEDAWKQIEQEGDPAETANRYIVLSIGEPEFCYRCAYAALTGAGLYVGMLGNHRKVQLVRERLLAAGLPEELLGKRFHAPIGLPLGGERPMEVALSILAEITRCRYAEKGPKQMEQEILHYLLKPEDTQRPCILAMILAVQGTAPRSAGSRMLVFEDGSILGTIGGGDTEYQAMQYAGRMFQTAERTAVITCSHAGHAVIQVMLCRI